MKDMNFNNLKNLKAPENWIENAINIPQAESKQKSPVIFRYTRVIAAVACLVLVCTVSLVLFFTRDTNILPIDPDYTQSENVTNNDDNSNAQEEQNGKNSHKNDKKPTNNGDAPLEDETSEHGESTSKSEDATTTKPPKETQKPNKPTQNPSATEPSDDTEDPPDPPYEEPSDPSWEEPSEEPTESIDPGSPPEAPPGSISAVFSTFIPKSEYTGGNVYCKIIDSNGNLLGDSNLYSREHRASVAGYTKDSYLLEYNASSKGVVTQPGYYTCYFYDSNGKVYSSYSTTIN